MEKAVKLANHLVRSKPVTCGPMQTSEYQFFNYYNYACLPINYLYSNVKIYLHCNVVLDIFDIVCRISGDKGYPEVWNPAKCLAPHILYCLKTQETAISINRTW